MRKSPPTTNPAVCPDPRKLYEDRDGSVLRQLNELKEMTVSQLREKHLELYGFPTKSKHKQQLFRRLAWRVQELKWGGLSEDTKRRLEEIAESIEPFDARFLPPRQPQTAHVVTLRPSRPSELRPGTMLSREYAGDLHQVTVIDQGIEYQGRVFRSLSGVAREITGTNWNGKRFFGLVDAKGAPR